MKKMRVAGSVICACLLVGSMAVPSFGLTELASEQVDLPESSITSSEEGTDDQTGEGQHDSAAGQPEQSKPVSSAEQKPQKAEAKDKLKLTASEKKRISKARSFSSKAGRLAGGLSSPRAELSDSTDDLRKSAERLSKLRQRYASTSRNVEDAKASVDEAQAQLDEVLERESSLTDVSFFSVLFGEVTYDELVSWSGDIAIEETQARDSLAAWQEELGKLNGELSGLEKRIDEQEQVVAAAIAAGNDIALELEADDSTSRMADEDAAQQLEGLNAKKPKVKSAVRGVEQSTKSHDSVRKSARAELSAWYDEVDELSGTESGLSFGAGADFALAEEEFVEKWGNAIDAFYEQFGSEAGFAPPLAGQGKTMAKYAYEYKIDPRLCAAVSIIESSGGKHCIKAYNAWGWGAADSDPYGGASSWGSWDEAICEWHKGMAESNTGLATANSLSELGETYCSSAHWAKEVSEQFQKIDACVK